MKLKLLYKTIIFIIILAPSELLAQQMIKVPPIICPASTEYRDHHVPPPEKFLKARAEAKTLSRSNFTAEIIVDYHGFQETSPQAQVAFQYAVDIWATLIKSDVPIYVDATYEPLESGVLGSAGPSFVFRTFEGAPNDSLYYGVATAEKLAADHINVPGEPDIVARFNSAFDWYLGTDGEPGDKYDFVSVVLHELGHGLGFFDRCTYDSDEDLGYFFNGVYDSYIVHLEGESIYDLEFGSKEMGEFLTSERLFLSAPLATAANNGSQPRINAPNTWSDGSSIAHWDIQFDGTPEALMTPSFSPGESVHDPGDVALGLFADMGWVHTFMRHNDVLVEEDFTSPIEISVSLWSDTTLVNGFDIPMIHYSTDNFANVTSAPMVFDGSGSFDFSIDNPGQNEILEYYIDGIEDVLGRSYSQPYSAFDGNNNLTNYYTTIIEDEGSISTPFLLEDGGDFESEGLFRSISLKSNGGFWEHGSPSNVLNTPSSGNNVWKTDLDGNIEKPSSLKTGALISPKLDLSGVTGDVNLTFDLTMDLDTSVMVLHVLSSTDGENWEVLGVKDDQRGENWYNVDTNFEQGILYGWVMNNSENGPLNVSYSLHEFIGQPKVYLAFVTSLSDFFDDDDYGFDGVMIDDFQITEGEPKARFAMTASLDGFNFPGQEIEFEFASNGATSYSWDFGDGNSSTEENPTHAYSAGGDYTVELTITYDGGTHTTSKEISVIGVQGPNYSLADGGDFESNIEDFRVDNVSGTPFERGQSTIEGKNGTSSGDFAWVTGIDAAEYVDQSEAFLYTPVMNMTNIGNYEFSFQTNYDTEFNFDGFIVEYSSNSGESWHQLVPEVADDWYDEIAEDNEEQGWPPIPLFSGNSDGWVTKRADVSSLGGNEFVAFRFHWLSDFALTKVGIAIDDFQLTGPADGPAVADFSYTESDGCAGQEIVFSNESSGTITEMLWDFGQFASPSTASGPGPHTVTYSGGPGTSTVAMTLNGGDVTETKTDIITTAPLFDPTVTQGSGLTLTASNGDSYQWFADGEPIEGETGQSFTPSGVGPEYQVAVTIDGCAVLSEVADVVTSVDKDRLQNQIVVYPNPGTGIFTIEGLNPSSEQVQVVVVDLLGKVVLQSNWEANERSIVDMSHLRSGTYILSLDSERINVVKRIVKE